MSHPSSTVPNVGTSGWNPWRTLRELDDVEFARVDLPAAFGGAVYSPVDGEGWAAILCSRDLSRVELADAVAHELVHHERGGGCPVDGMPPQWAAVAVRAERSVEAEVARRRVPLHELEELVDALDFMGLPVEVWDIAQQFDVSEPVAATALRLLAEQREARDG